MVERGMNKDQLYNLLGRPHFSEGLYGVREWTMLLIIVRMVSIKFANTKFYSIKI